MLVPKGLFKKYMALLREAHQADHLESVMYRNLISIDWRGCVYDCDFNQMLDLPLAYKDKSRMHISQLMGMDLAGNPHRGGRSLLRLQRRARKRLWRALS